MSRHRTLNDIDKKISKLQLVIIGLRKERKIAGLRQRITELEKGKIFPIKSIRHKKPKPTSENSSTKANDAPAASLDGQTPLIAGKSITAYLCGGPDGPHYFDKPAVIKGKSCCPVCKTQAIEHNE